MKNRFKLFRTKDIYNLPATDQTFVAAMEANVAYHTRKCPKYRDILARLGYRPETEGAPDIRDVQDARNEPSAREAPDARNVPNAAGTPGARGVPDALDAPGARVIQNTQGVSGTQAEQGTHGLRGVISTLSKIPPLPTSYLKNNTLLSKPYNKLIMKTTSSGTGGAKTLSGFDISSGICGLFMLLRVFRFHGLISLRRTNYVILGYQPDKSNQTAMAKALKAVTLFAPAAKTVYALSVIDGEYQVNTDGIVEAISEFGRQNRPVRIVGFPAYFKMLLDELNGRSIKLKLHENSKVLLGGGWKAFFADAVSKDELYHMANETLGVSRKNFKDHFSTAEHPINYVSCECNRFHIPVFSRVVIRDVKTLTPVPPGTPGLLNLITPLLSSMPYGSILTDDIAVLIDGGGCGCGSVSPYFELIGRVGLASVKTCAQAASEFLKDI